MCSARGRDLFSALVLVLSAVLAKVNLSRVLFYITSWSEEKFLVVLNVEVLLDFMTIWCILCVITWKRVKDDHLACVWLFTHFSTLE